LISEKRSNWRDMKHSTLAGTIARARLRLFNRTPRRKKIYQKEVLPYDRAVDRMRGIKG
jgi:hypothetical protein